MLILVLYDVSTADRQGMKRLRRIARACEDFGQRVQKSVFECQVGAKEWVALRARLLSEMEPKHDSLRFYFLDADVRIEHHGVSEPIDLDGPLII